MPDAPANGRRVRPTEPAEQRALTLARRPAEQEGGQHGDQREREQERPHDGHRDRHRHRPEELALDPLEGEDRHVHGHDDDDGERQRARDLERRVLDLAHDAVARRPPLGQVTEDVLGHDDGPVDDDPEVDGSQRKQVGRDPAEIHEDEREQERQRDREGDDEGRAQVVEEEREQHDDERGAFDEVAQHGGDGGLYQTVTTVIVVELDAGGQHALYLDQLLLHAFDHRVGVLALAHEDDALHEIVLVVTAEDTEADGVTDSHLADVADADRRALLGGHHHVGEVLGRAEQADATHHERVLTVAQVAAAGVGIVGGHRVEDLLEREVVAAQPAGIDGDLVLLDPTAPRHHVGHARDLPELALQHPVLKGLHLDERHRLRFERVAVDLADRAGQRPQPRLGVGWQLGPGDPLEHLLAGPVVVGAVGEEDVDVGEAEVGHRAQKGDAGDAVQLFLELNGDEPLDFLGGAARPDRDDVDLDVGDVGIGFDGQAVI